MGQAFITYMLRPLELWSLVVEQSPPSKVPPARRLNPKMGTNGKRSLTVSLGLHDVVSNSINQRTLKQTPTYFTPHYRDPQTQCDAAKQWSSHECGAMSGKIMTTWLRRVGRCNSVVTLLHLRFHDFRNCCLSRFTRLSVYGLVPSAFWGFEAWPSGLIPAIFFPSFELDDLLNNGYVVKR